MPSAHPDLLTIESATIRGLLPWSAWPPVTVRDQDVFSVACAIPSILFNGVVRAVLDDPATVERRIDETLGHYRALGVPMAWSVGPSSRPADLADRLAARGLVRGEPSRAMILALRAPDDLAPPPAAGRAHPAVVTTVADDADLAAWSSVVNDAFGTPVEAASAWLELHRALGLTGDPSGGGWRHWIARLDATAPLPHDPRSAVGAASLFLAADPDAPAVVANVAVRPGHRRRGLGDALTRAVLAAARRDGRRRAVLCASRDAVALYERIGFRVRGTMPNLRTPG